VRSALKGVDGVKTVDLSVYSDVYTLTFRRGVEPDEKTVREVFKGCQFNGRRVVVERDPAAVENLRIPRPLPPAPADNPTTSGRVALGKRLFNDERLSKDGTTACSSCHQPQHAMADGRVMASGLHGRGIQRNVPTLVNVGYRKSIFWDGHAAGLEQMALGAIEHPAVIDMDPDEMTTRLRSIPAYHDLFQREFGHPPTAEAFAKALAAYQRSLLSNNTPFDRFAQGDEQAISRIAHRGYVIFRDKANCITCHSGPDFTDGAFRRIGVGWDGKRYKDLGRGKIHGRKGANGLFRVAPLRELVWTAPYMHDGSLKTLKEVVDFYNEGGPKGPPIDLHGPLNLSEQEIEAVVEFLKALSSDRPPGMLPRAVALSE
jgi:cytochrome c peroxidase